MKSRKKNHSTWGYGYGSEFQLMRFLGRHRNELNNVLGEALGVSKDINWLDFGYNESNTSEDRELVGFSFLDDQKLLRLDTRSFWPEAGPNWDAVGVSDGSYLLVEAKAHIPELLKKNGSGAQSTSREIIWNSIQKFQRKHGLKQDEKWLTHYYQLANRLAFCDYLNDNGISCKLVYILFVNGYKHTYGSNPIDTSLNVDSDTMWYDAFNKLTDEMGIKDTLVEGLIKTVIVNAAR